MHRRDGQRSGSTKTAVPAQLAKQWEIELEHQYRKFSSIIVLWKIGIVKMWSQGAEFSGLLVLSEFEQEVIRLEFFEVVLVT